ncbi:hypothetical protein D9758_009436 [Tetrapyrgos nigripes]|uniref:Endo-beta-1,6-galactanase-like domain-containing protein n=1 Tax=Tetrapyrgos nigripes TaxID=182062 RepID=A0A8H5D1R9_9AGAR|nr:hypothetical protein D9758_009436 [Tetrapyrgos nigripes]
MSPTYRAFLSVLAVSALLPHAQTATISSTPAQTFLGIGGSGAWWPNDLFQFPDSVRQNLSSLLFSQSGLGLSSYRYNVGSGGVGVSNPTRAPQTFYVSPGQYDFTKDAAGVYFLTQASKFGVHDLTMFANSAPAPLTSAGTSCGSQFKNGTGSAYGTFLAEVTQHFRSQGILINLISPMNEPDSSFGPTPCGQEGMLVQPNQRAEVVNGLWNALNALGLASAVGILADESSQLAFATSEYSSWLPQVVDKVAALVHHTYDFPSDSSYSSFISNEICCTLGQADGTGKGYSQGYDPTITNALLFSGLVFQSLVVAGEPHYDFWTLVSNGIGCDPSTDPSCATRTNGNGWNDGVIYYDPNFARNGNHGLYIKKQFWTYKHFGNFVKPGTQRLPITGSDSTTNSMLAISNSTTIVIIAMNTRTSDSTLSLTFPANVCARGGFRTSATEDFASIASATGSGSSWSLRLASLSLKYSLFPLLSIPMSEIHLREVDSFHCSPKVKTPPKTSEIPTPFSYIPSDDGTDENLLILLHGLGVYVLRANYVLNQLPVNLGDTHIPFSKLGRQFKLPQTAVIAIRAPEQVPFLYEEAYQWYTSFDPLGELISRPNPTPALEFLSKVFDHLTDPTQCAWPPNKIHLFGFAQGGSVALEFGITYWRKQLEQHRKAITAATTTPDEEDKGFTSANNANNTTSTKPIASLGSIVTITGPLLSYPTLSSPSPTPILAVYRPPPAEPSLSSGDLTAIKKAYSAVKEVKLGPRGPGMPSSQEEWEGIMRFWSERLSRRPGDGLYEVMSGMNA